MKTTELDPRSITAAGETVPENTPFVMLNLLRYRKNADYGDRTDLDGRSGREAYYQGYIAGFRELAARSESTKSIQPLFVGSVLASLIAPTDEQWDEILLVEYPNFAAFRSVVESVEYERDVAPHRKAALEDWRLIATLKQA